VLKKEMFLAYQTVKLMHAREHVGFLLIRTMVQWVEQVWWPVHPVALFLGNCDVPSSL
jgi:hypothetical protein